MVKPINLRVKKLDRYHDNIKMEEHGFMRQKDIAKLMAMETGLTFNKCFKVINSFMVHTCDALSRREEVSLRMFGKFYVKDRKVGGTQRVTKKKLPTETSVVMFKFAIETKEFIVKGRRLDDLSQSN